MGVGRDTRTTWLFFSWLAVGNTRRSRWGDRFHGDKMIPARLRDFLRRELGIDLYDWKPGEIEF